MAARAFMAGVAGAGMTVIAGLIAPALSIEPELASLAGSVLVGPDGANGRVALAIGIVAQLLAGGVLGVAYAALLARAAEPIVLAGAFLGLLHAMIAGVLLAAIPVFHPAVPGALRAPGVLMSAHGAAAAIYFVVLHVGFGVAVGWLALPRRDVASGPAAP